MIATQTYMPVSRRALDLEDYINVARRHAGWILGPVYAGLVISIVIAYSLQNVYEAKATMEIRPSQISENLVQTTINQRLTERIQQMETNVLSRQGLSLLIQDPHLNLYPEDRIKLPMEDVEDNMRKDVHIVIAPESVTTKGASNFSILFSYPKKKEAHDTVQALVTRFIDQSTNSTRAQQTTLKDFFGEQVNVSRAELEKRNEALTKFRKDHEGKLPEQEGMNIAALNSLEQQVSGLQQELSRLANEKSNIETNISYLKSQMGMTDLLVDETPSLTNPVFRQNDEIAQLNKQIDGIELNLQQLRQTYRDTFPDIRSFQKNLDVLKKKRDGLVATQEKEHQAEAAKPAAEQKKPTNVRMAMSRAAIDGEIAKDNTLLLNNQRNQEAARKNIDGYTKEIEGYRARLAETSVLEAQYADLKRDALSATDKYEKLQHQQDLTRENADLADRGATEVLEQVDAPTVPQKPTRPDRPLIVGAGVAISLLLGLALAGIQEAKDSSLKNLKDVRAYTNLPVLCSIPLLENTLLVKRKRRITYLAWAAAIIVGILAVGASTFYYLSVISNT
ncbi:MAG TPA: hypothetical protein VFC21_11080 [Bryobacteraceae bacterium]|nr:hypothetical protein [Bryobacteraceae bacterium]